MRPVHIGIGHDDDLVIAKLLQVQLFAEPGTQGRDDGTDLRVGEYLVITGLFHVEDLASQGQNGLRSPVPPLLCRSAG